MQRDRVVTSIFHVRNNGSICGVNRIGFRRSCQIDDALRQSELAFGQSDEIKCILGIEGDPQSAGIG